jgi:hypothetical protein
LKTKKQKLILFLFILILVPILGFQSSEAAVKANQVKYRFAYANLNYEISKSAPVQKPAMLRSWVLKVKA